MAQPTETRDVELQPGPQQPHRGTPARRPASVRRTTTHTSLRPDGILGDVHTVARGRDLWTPAAGDPVVLAEAALDATIAYVDNRRLQAIRLEPSVPSIADLVGSRVSSGFRKAVDEAWSGEDRAASLAYQLLDDLPGATLVAGFAISAAGMHAPRAAMDLSRQTDICAGWAAGGTILSGADRIGYVPVLMGPSAPPLDDGDDRWAWHALGPMPPLTMRRWRRIDVWWPDPAAPISVEAFFRDCHVDGEGVETVVHEYLVTAELEPVSHRFVSCRADVGVLPWMECPGALASASRVEGTTPHDLRQRIRESFVGTSTCTHLNDTLRALAALPFLAGQVEYRAG